MTPTNDGWILTASGIQFDLFDPLPTMVAIEDVAHALANVCRFAGHTREFYSVAQHSVIVSENVPTDQALVALLHDATEAYCGDMVRPLKRQMPDYQKVEKRIWAAIRLRFRLGEISPVIKEADERALQTERRDVMIPSSYPWKEDEQRARPFMEVITPLAPAAARDLFLRRWAYLNELRQHEVAAAACAEKTYGHDSAVLGALTSRGNE